MEPGRIALPPLVNSDALAWRRLVKDPFLVAGLPAADSVNGACMRVRPEASPGEAPVLPLARKLCWPSQTVRLGVPHGGSALRIDQPEDHRATRRGRWIGIEEDARRVPLMDIDEAGVGPQKVIRGRRQVVAMQLGALEIGDVATLRQQSRP